MIEQPGRRRVLVAAGAEDRLPLPVWVGAALTDWEVRAAGGRSRWLTQRHALERLDEEVARAERHGTPLSLALAEVQALRPPGAPGRDELPLTAAVGEQVASAIRRGDVAGRYGPAGFLLL